MNVVIVRNDPDEGAADGVSPAVQGPEARFSQLPQRIELADTITSAETVARSGPELQRDPEQEWMLRFAFL